MYVINVVVTGLTYEAYKEEAYGGAPHAGDRCRPTLVARWIDGKLRPSWPPGLVTLAFFKMDTYSKILRQNCFGAN